MELSLCMRSGPCRAPRSSLPWFVLRTTLPEPGTPVNSLSHILRQLLSVHAGITLCYITLPLYVYPIYTCMCMHYMHSVPTYVAHEREMNAHAHLPHALLMCQYVACLHVLGLLAGLSLLPC